MPSTEDTADERPRVHPGPEGQGDRQDRQDDRQDRIGFIGKRLGRFLISAELGRGGMATVYRARDPQVGRDVAVKVMHGFFAGRTEIEARFRREANAVAAIRHPSILALYDFAPPAGEEPGYIVSELIEGPGLRQLAEERGGRLLPEVAALITVRVAEALGAAHAAGIVHRDVKPDNVLIDVSGGRARVVLTDFGVAHVSGMDTMTATGAVLGSPAYMSPEQARGEDVGPSSDVFSLGVLMYQLCTGHLPFAGKDPLSVITALLRGDYVRPAKLEARVGPAWEQVITRCLARDPAARFPDGNAVAQAVRGLLAAAGLADEQAALRRYLSDPDAFQRETSPGIARLALAAAEQARRQRQIPRALAEVGRALAYAPHDSDARELLGRLGSRQRTLWMRVGVAAGTVVVAVGAFAFVFARQASVAPVLQPPSTKGAAAPANHSSVGQRAVNQPVQPTTTLLPNSLPSPSPSTTVTAVPSLRQRRGPGATLDGPAMGRDLRRKERPDRSRAADRPQSAIASSADSSASNAAAIAPPEVIAEAPAANPLPAPTPVAVEQTASVVLRASHGFCEPSLDGHPPSLRAKYNDLAPGPHEIFCTLPQGGGKIRVATYNLRPGTRPSLTIVPGPNGHPVLGRPE
ncbi:MAG: serine/threonine protein kinase [Deltaproteobacteria bacterium]|nr:serine/threonine protein kinase [Deltaproteobacteria bacterium]